MLPPCQQPLHPRFRTPLTYTASMSYQVIGIDASALWRTGVPYQDLARAGASLSLCTVTVGSDDESLGPGTDESYSLRIDEEGEKRGSSLRSHRR